MTTGEIQKPKQSFLSRILFWVNIAFAASLLLSNLAASVSPQKNWWLAMFGLGFGIIAFVNFLFLVYYTLRRKRKLLLSLVALLLVINKLFGIYEIRFSKPPELKNAMKVMTYNVRLFDLYNWYHNFETRKKIFDMLRKQSPDIVCFQEYFSSERHDYDYNNADTLRTVLSCPYAHIYYTVNLHGNKDHWGIATYSRYPIINRKVVLFDSKRRRAFIYSDVVNGSDTIRVINVHLESIGFKAEDYRFVENLGEEDQEELQGAMNIGRRLKRAFVRRSSQAERLHEEIKNSPYPVIVCGDFNDTPTSYTYKTVSDGMKDAFRVSGSGSGKTYLGVFPSFRIDYILHSDRLQSSGYTKIEEPLSDHYPVYCYISPGKRNDNP